MVTDGIEDLVACHLRLLDIDTKVCNGQFKQFGMLEAVQKKTDLLCYLKKSRHFQFFLLK